MLGQFYYETDKRLVFGVGRHYMFRVLTELGLLQKQEEQTSFWVAGGFYRKRNQMVSGLSYKEFLTLFQDAYHKLRKEDPQLDEAAYLRTFLESFIRNADHIRDWEGDFNKKRHGEYMKSQRQLGQKLGWGTNGA